MSNGNSAQITLVNPTITNSSFGPNIAHHSNPTSDSPASPEKSNPTSIDNVRQARSRFVVNQSYLKAKHVFENGPVHILHLQGIPGSGKSEIVRKLAADFALGETTAVVKWHIECRDSSHDVKDQLQKLLTLMVGRNMLQVNESLIESANNNLLSNRCKEYINLLSSVHFPILIIVEDPRDQAFLGDFLSCVLGAGDRNEKLHVYITSNIKDICELPESSGCLMMLEVVGLTEEEAFRLLEMPENASNDEVSSAKKIIERLSGSPLGLLAVKSAKSSSYKKYLERLQKDSLANIIIEREEKQSKLKHIYKAILMLLEPAEGSGDALKYWQAICSLSFFHHGNIPQILVSRVMHYLREDYKSVEESELLNEMESCDFVEKHVNYGMCRTTGGDLVDGRVTFHEVVIRAVRQALSIRPDLRTSVLLVATKAAASVAHKDLRKAESRVFMMEMYPHILSILDFSASNNGDLLLQLCRGHLYEVAGMLCSQQDFSRAENFLTMSLEVLFGVVRTFTTRDVKIEMLKRSLKMRQAVNLIFEALTEAGLEILRSGFDLETYISVILQPRSINVGLGDLGDNHTNYIKEAAERAVPLAPQKLQQIREESSPFFLGKDTLFTTYLVERTASVLHSMSRLLLYTDEDVTTEKSELFHGFSTFAVEICEEVRKRYKIGPLFLHITSNVLVDLRLKGNFLKNLTVNEQRSLLLETKAIVEKKLAASDTSETPFYEHGISRAVTTDNYARLVHRRSLVRIYTKLISLGQQAHFQTEEADNACQTLYDSAKSKLEWKISPNCIIYCGKYWASKENYSKALEHFDEAFTCKGLINPSFHWGCYNHARSVLKGNVRSKAESSKIRCEEALKRRKLVSQNLFERLCSSVDQLQVMLDDNEVN